MQSPPIGQAEIEARIEGYLDELLRLWWAEQGAAKARELELMASSLPFPREHAIRILDLCCGPGDVGRAIRREYRNAQIDCVDRDPFLTAICRAVNRRERIPGEIIVYDLEDREWTSGLSKAYDVVATANALHWFDTATAERLLKDVGGLLRCGGVFLLAEPVWPEAPFAAGFEGWKQRLPPRYTRENWERFWSRANALLDYDHVALLGDRHSDRIGDSCITVAGWVTLLSNAGFEPIDVLLRDADGVVIGCLKP
jgi:SAM-dependent methyltransferase